ncbi:MAG: DUF58 domain-containing protein [Clostridia bacterium]|nr:DUF58 domain-containing protein [Clostridia bacterium]
MARSRIIYLALLIGAFIFSQALLDSISLFTLAVVVLIPIISLICMVVSLFLIKIEVEEPPHKVCRLNEFCLRATIKSKTPILLPLMKFNLTVSNSDGDESVRGYSIVHFRAFGETVVEIPMNYSVRGIYKAGINSVVLYDFLRLFSVKKKLQKTVSVVVTPRTLRLELPVHASRQEQENVASVGGRETKNSGDMAGIREFNEYDTLRQVHWKLSARLSKMIVKTYWENSCDNIMVLADLFPYEEELLMNRRLTDCVVEMAGQLMTLLNEAGVRTTLGYGNYESMMSLRSITTPEERLDAGDELAMTPMMEYGSFIQSLHEMDFNSLQGGALYVVSSMKSEQLVRAMEPYLRGLNCTVYYFSIRPEIEAEANPQVRVLTLTELE